MDKKTMRSAHQAVAAALHSGSLEKGVCEYADEEICKGRIEAHHDDYSKPLAVRWLCRRHHSRLHASNGDVSTKVQMGFYVAEDLADQIRAMAAKERRSLSQEIIWLIERGIEAS